MHILNDYNNIKQCRSELQIGTDIPLNPNSRQRKKSGPTFSAFLKKAFFFEGGGGNFQESSLVLIPIVLDSRNRMALSDFKNSAYSMSYG